ncbi:VOC family protein [Phaeovulum sp. W22_SRMD_FR3]|uniref:VOC family protein n=1 Tax=Phaeovulum sp. W22_SRMD_FR3 TaxID=3240274 RepID=UPI003F9A3DAF
MKLGYTMIYGTDMPKTIAFYEAAFGLAPRFIHESSLYAEMETGETTLAFAGIEAAEMNGLALMPNRPERPAAAWDICFVTDDVACAYNRELSAGCRPVSATCIKPWGQIVSYVRDLDGCIVEIASPIGGTA